MNQPRHESIKHLSSIGLRMSYITTPGGYHPIHWHEELEILYPLNGVVDVWIDGKKHILQKKHLIVVESSLIHSTYAHSKASMFLYVHLSKEKIKEYLPDIEFRRINCIPDELDEQYFPKYRKICELIELLTVLYIKNVPFYSMEAEGILLQIMANLFRDFSVEIAPDHANDKQTMDRIREIITYVEENYREPISLQDISDHLGVTREYFCRFFKKNMGVSFLNYLNEVRLSHIYKELQNTDAPISEIMENNGFTNQKLFNRTFKKLYNQTPSSVRHPHNLPESD